MAATLSICFMSRCLLSRGSIDWPQLCSKPATLRAQSSSIAAAVEVDHLAVRRKCDRGIATTCTTSCMLTERELANGPSSAHIHGMELALLQPRSSGGSLSSEQS